MGRRQLSRGARGSRMLNAAVGRVCGTLFTSDADGGMTGTTEVPDYVAVPKCTGKKHKGMERRAVMKGKMILKGGSTGCGCVEGCIGNIVHTLSEKENALINAMGPGSDEAGEDEAGEAFDDYLFGNWMVVTMLT